MRIRIGWLALCGAAVVSFSGCDDDAVITPIPQMEAGVDLDFGPPPDRFIPPDMSPRGQLGDLCMDGSDCASGYCVERPGGGRVCTERCGDGSCPDGWECQLVDNGGADATFFCLADQPDLCRPCELDVECDDNEDLCIQIGARTYCGESCEGEGDCPEGYECASIERDEQTFMQCVPTSGECQPCIDMDGDGYGEGDGCLGFDCADDDPTTHEGAPELCDGVDNNCIDGIDEREAIAEEPPEDLTCSDQGVCAGSFVICNAGEWICNYPDTYEAGAETLCDGLDNDCDGTPDDDLDLTSDPANCRFCGNACDFENAVGLCAESNCELGDCDAGFYNVDGNDGNGCEYACNLTLEGVEACDQVDNDCDGGTDEDFDQQTDINHCGQCNRVCAFQNATPSCVAGECGIDACDAGWTDLNGMLADGCEFECGPTNGGVEICDTIDNDCDGTPDEGFDFANSLEHCGQCNRACAYPNAMAACVEGDCALSDCAPGFVNANGDLADGCEYACVPTRDGVEACDQIDNDCDGEVDEDFRNLPEVCDQGDNDCDGNIDEGFDLQVDRDNCGVCGNACDLPDAIGRCAAGQCAVAECQGGFIDLDGLAENGCEYACQLTNGGLEACDDIDNDCDGNLDEDAPVDADPENCGACGRRCEFANADGACVASECVLDACEDGFVDLDGNPDNGCEYACQFVSDDDVPDVGNVDANCDGVDGDIARAIFVRTDGDDEQDGLTVETAVATLEEAIEIAAGDAGRDQILIEAGVYRVDAPVALQGGMGLYSGYSNDFRVRGGNRALIESTAGRGVTAIGLEAPTVLERIDIQVTNRSDASASAVALFVDNSADHLTVREGSIRAGRGGAGATGNPGANGAEGTRGANGSGSSGGNGGSLGGGDGGNGRRRAGGESGDGGESNGSACGGSRGAGNSENIGCDVGIGNGDPLPGANGSNGCSGGRGSQGLAGNGVGRFFADGSFRTSNGTPGGRGVHGGGGGGAGAGGGEDCAPVGCDPIFGVGWCGTGRGGGGGGGGGRGGNGGLGGMGGGASIAIQITNSSVVVEAVDIITLGGGIGGRGGNGGSGGTGGQGGSGAVTNDPAREAGGGNGGDGGNGGTGGCGGGGGGGPSIGVWGRGNATLIQRGEVAFDVAAGGAGGAVCAQGGGRAGAAGTQQDTRDVNLQ